MTLPFECTDWLDLNDEMNRIITRLDASGNVRRFLASITDLNEHNKKVQMFRVGMCHGVWYPTPTEYRILFIGNKKKGNGHFAAAVEWFEESCRRDKRALVFESLTNLRLKKHLIKKRGFTERGNDCIKYF